VVGWCDVVGRWLGVGLLKLCGAANVCASVSVCLWYLCCCCVHYECRAAVYGAAGCGCVLSLLCCVRGDVTGSIGDMIRSGRDGSGWAVGGAASGVAEGAAGGSCCVVDARSR
jgi:hypothetical protein